MGSFGHATAQHPRLRGGLAVATVSCLVVGALVVGGSIASTLEVVAVVTFLVGSAIALGAFDGRACSSTGAAPDRWTSARAHEVLASLDRIEHRRVELGTPWPQLSVGPTGVDVVDVCNLDGVPVLGATRRAAPHGCARCSEAVETGRAAAEALAASGLDLPIRVIAVVAPGTPVALAGRPDLDLVTVDRLADVLARGALLPMPVVDAAFLVLSRAAMVVDGR